MSDKIYYHKHFCPCCQKSYDCVLSECESSDGKEETCSRCWMVGLGRAAPEEIHSVITYATRKP